MLVVLVVLASIVLVALFVLSSSCIISSRTSTSKPVALVGLAVLVVLVVGAPPYQPPLLHTLFAHIRVTLYLQHFRHVGTSYEASKFTCEFANSSFRFWTCILGGGVGGEGG